MNNGFCRHIKNIFQSSRVAKNEIWKKIELIIHVYIFEEELRTTMDNFKKNQDFCFVQVLDLII